MKILSWTWYGNPDYQEMSLIGETRKEVEQLIIEELRNKGYRFTGDYHQDGDYGVPVFDNGMVATFSKREWGAIMYKAYPDDGDYPEDLKYVKWAWDWPEMTESDRIFPKE